ncbi:MAG: glycosyltransferase, partial [Candidatus Aminicenantales bacterium]
MKKRQDFILQIIGEGPEKESLIDLAEELKIKDYIKFEGFVQKPRLPEYLARADCFVFPSEYDIWGLVLVEAMAAGLPCFASYLAGAAHDIIEDGKTGFVVDFSDYEKIADKIDWLFRHPEVARKIGQNARRFIQENLTLEKSASGFLEAINAVCADNMKTNKI